jgi:hypothetical protein
MKTIYLLILVFIFSSAQAQFSADPANPFAIANAPSEQLTVRHLPDGSGGYFVFWLDKRTDATNKDLYGQHLDEFGDPLWTANGKLLVNVPGKSVNSFVCKTYGGGILLAWFSNPSGGYGDSLQVKKIDTNGNDVWNAPTTVAVKNGTIGISGGLQIMPNDSGAFITYTMIYIGGGTAIEFNRVDFNGNLRWPMNSNAQVVNGYDYRSCSDGLNGIYLLGKGNGLGSQMFIQRFDLQGNSVFPPTDITNGGGSNGFAGNITLLNDNEGNLYCIYDGNNYRVLISKIDSSGNVSHAALKVADYTPQSAQFYSYARLINGTIYSCWNDDRQGPIHVFVQKMDTSCAPLWSVDGVDIAATNTYCYPKIAMSDSNAVAVFHVTPAVGDVVVQRVRDDSSLTWPTSYIVANVSGGAPSDNDAELADDAGGCNAVFWATSGTANVLGAKLCSDGHLVNVQNVDAVAAAISVYPNPASDFISIDLQMRSSQETIRIYDVLGNLVLTSENKSKIDVRSLHGGLYIIAVRGKESTCLGKFIKQ